jgi:hypothetical protein
MAWRSVQVHGLYGWGANLVGELGLGATGQQNNIVRIGTEEDWQFIEAAEGAASGMSVIGFHTLGLRSSEEKICVTGGNYVGQLGNGTEENLNEFVCDVGDEPSDITQIITLPPSVLVYPNPANESFFIETENFQNKRISFFSSDGRLLFQQKLTDSTTEIRQAQLKSKGLIFYKITDDAGATIRNGKIILN